MTYVDNYMNRRYGRAGKPYGTHILHNNGTMTICEDNPTPVTIGDQVAVVHSRVYVTDVIANRSNWQLIRTNYTVLHTGKSEACQPGASVKSGQVPALPAGSTTTQTTLGTQDSTVSASSHSNTNKQDDDSTAAVDVPDGSNKENDGDFGQLVDEKQESVIPLNEVSITVQDVCPEILASTYSGTWRGMKIAFQKFSTRKKPAKWMKKLRSEIQFLCKLDHPNILRLYGGVLTKELSGVVMEYVPHSLYQAVFTEDQERKLDDMEKRRIVRQISEGLFFLHDSNIVHCNLTTKTVLIAEYNVVKISGHGPKFQASKVESVYELVGQFDPIYTAPEIRRKELLTPDQLKKADMYSLAAVAYEVMEEKKLCDLISIQDVTASKSSIDLAKTLKFDQMSSSIFDALCECWKENASLRPTTREFIARWKSL